MSPSVTLFLIMIAGWMIHIQQAVIDYLVVVFHPTVSALIDRRLWKRSPEHDEPGGDL